MNIIKEMKNIETNMQDALNKGKEAQRGLTEALESLARMKEDMQSINLTIKTEDDGR